MPHTCLVDQIRRWKKKNKNKNKMKAFTTNEEKESDFS